MKLFSVIQMSFSTIRKNRPETQFQKKHTKLERNRKVTFINGDSTELD